MPLSSGQKALLNYLDDLLLDITPPSPIPRGPNPSNSVAPAPLPSTSALLPVASAPAVSLDKHQLQTLLDAAYSAPSPAEAQPLTPCVTAPVASPSTPTFAPTSEIASPSVEPALADAMPHSWKQAPFDALLLKVSGLSLAVPIITLGHIYPITQGLSRLPSQPAWLLGLLNTPNGSIRTLNTALFVMPERYNPQFEQSAQYVVTLHNFPLGLAVDAIEQPIKIHPQEVAWRNPASKKRPWLAGTLKSHLCALLDLQQMAESFPH